MRHLLSHTVNPNLPLLAWLRRWPTISASLCEPPRTRRLQMAALRELRVFLS
jgi:hypothetical protein